MKYKNTILKTTLSVSSIISIHYFDYMSDFSFPGESHDFWELLCVDKGEIDAMAGQGRHTLKRGSIIFHQPNEFHNVITNGRSAPSLVVIAFECHSPYMDAFRGQILTVQETESALLAQIIIEARQAFIGRLDNPYQEELVRNTDSPGFGAEQLIRNYLEELLIHLYRRYFANPLPVPAQNPGHPRLGRPNETYNRIVRYMEEHVNEQLTIETICKNTLISRSRLQKLFQEQHGCGVMEFFNRMKIDTAKELIRSNQLNFTQISDRLGYGSVHYFSRQFKKITHMTPSEYASSIRLLSENCPIFQGMWHPE
ncbi:MAG: AraC family transcriptional regulator [Lachnospiraceae bacterium]|nr:AraC family transcriptional regulator [Lachnospiraceae bacterium]